MNMNLEQLVGKCKEEIIKDGGLNNNVGATSQVVDVNPDMSAEVASIGTKIAEAVQTTQVAQTTQAKEIIPGSGIPRVEIIPGFENISERLNEYVEDIATEYDTNLTKGVITPQDITSKRALDVETKEAIKEDIIKSGEHLNIVPENNIVHQPTEVKKDTPVIPVYSEGTVKIKSRVDETVNNDGKVIVTTETCKTIAKTVLVTEDNKKAWEKIMSKRRKAIRTALVPAVISNAILRGYPLSSNAIIESLQPKSDKSVYQNLTNLLTILANFIEVQGLGQLSGYQLSRIVSYLDLELLYYVVFKASNDDRYKFDMACANPDCSKYGEDVVKVDIDVDDIAHPVDLEKYKVHVENIKEYTDEADIIKHSPANIITVIDDVDNDRVFKIKIPSIFDYIKNVAIKLDESHDSYKEIINIIPFIHEIVIKDYETETEYVVKEFEDILEILVKYTSDEIITKATEIVDKLVDGRMVDFYIKKEAMVCPYCGKKHPNDLAVLPSRMLFLLPEMRKSVEK